MMSKIGEYDDWKKGHSSAGEQEKFKETGKIPVSGKYTSEGQAETRNIPLSELYGGGGADIPMNGNNCDVLTFIKTTEMSEPELKWESGVHRIQSGDGIFVSGSAGDLLIEVSYDRNNGDTLTLDDNNNLAVTNPVPYPGDNHEHEGHVLTVMSDEIVWAAPQGGGGLPDPASVIGKKDGSGAAAYAEFIPYCECTCDANDVIISTGPLKWGYKLYSSNSKPVDGDLA